MSSEQKILCLILAAGKGTRMKSALPKVMHSVGGKPMLAHVIETCQQIPNTEVAVVVGQDMPAVTDLCLGYQAETILLDAPLGTGYAVRAAREKISNHQGKVIVLYGDSPLVTAETINLMIEALNHAAHPAVVVLGMEPNDPGKYGRLVLNADGTLARIVEFADASEAEKKITLCNAGFMAFDGAKLPNILDQIGNENAQGEYYLTDAVEIAKQQGDVCIVVQSDVTDAIGVNSRSDLAYVESLYQNRLRQKFMQEGVTLVAPETVWFSADSKIGRDVVIEPNVIIGPNVEIEENVEILAFSHLEGAKILKGASIGPYARLRPGAIIEEKAKIGNFVEIKKATISQGAKVNHLSYIGDAQIGAKTNIGAGTITCNYDGYFKHQTVVGEHSFIGSNTALVAPVTIASGAMIAAGSVVTENVEQDSLYINRAKPVHKKGFAAKFRELKERLKQQLK